MDHTNDPLHSNARKALSATISAICAGVPLSQAHAQDADESALKLEEVIVTATKRGALSLQDVPMSITAFTDENIRAQGFKTLDDLVIPTGFEQLYISIPPNLFRQDISSTELRGD